MTPYEEFKLEGAAEIASLGRDADIAKLTREWMGAVNAKKYSYHFEWMGRPIIQYPQDIVAVQELIWQIRPDLIIETGIAHGGSLVLSASMLALLDVCDAIESGVGFDPAKSDRRVIGVDIDIRTHNREAVARHPMASRIRMIQGSSVDPAVIADVHSEAREAQSVLVFLDSMHAHDHVLKELDAYAPLVTLGSYCIAFDTVIEDLPPGSFADRPWAVGDNPKTAVHAWIGNNRHFEIDREIQNKLQITVAPDGFLKRVS